MKVLFFFLCWKKSCTKEGRRRMLLSCTTHRSGRHFVPLTRLATIRDLSRAWRKRKSIKKTVAVHALLQLAYIVAYQNRCTRTRRNFFLSSHRERFKSNYASRGSKCANKVNCSNYDRSFSEIFRQIQFQFQQVSVQGWYRDCKDARQCLHRKSVAVDMRFSFICIGAQIVSRCPMHE